MLRLKACPRCNGDEIVVWTHGEQSASCLQCGYATVVRLTPRPVAVTRRGRVQSAAQSRASSAA
jgi:Zn ribbon nucleic-acid-binding protein